MKEKTETFLVDDGSEGLRLDKFLSQQLTSLSRSKINSLIKNNRVLIDNQVRKASFRVNRGEEISITIPLENDRLPPYNFPLKIIYEDDSIIVVDKPAGITVHPPQRNYSETLVNALIYLRKDLANSDPLRPGVVHRLDKETSGVIVFAKNSCVHARLVDQFRQHQVKKEYFAIVWGEIEKKEFNVNLPLQRDDKNRLKMKVGFFNAKNASTQILVSRKLEGATLLSIFPLTGRMHQIRVHLKYLGYPIVGDKKYGIKDGYSDLFLHAQILSFRHPETGKLLTFSSALPKKFDEFIKTHKLRNV